jgi:RHS repeat-associated protein
VRATLTDDRFASDADANNLLTLAEVHTRVLSFSDYYAFGMQMVGRNASTSDYRYGFQGQETDDEITGSESHVSYKYRMHDARLGRFLSLDPLAPQYPHNSPYAFSENRVIDAIELEGLEQVYFMKSFEQYGFTVAFELFSESDVGKKYMSVFLKTEGNSANDNQYNKGYDAFYSAGYGDGKIFGKMGGTSVLFEKGNQELGAKFAAIQDRTLGDAEMEKSLIGQYGMEVVLDKKIANTLSQGKGVIMIVMDEADLKAFQSAQGSTEDILQYWGAEGAIAFVMGHEFGAHALTFAAELIRSEDEDHFRFNKTEGKDNGTSPEIEEEGSRASSMKNSIKHEVVAKANKGKKKAKAAKAAKVTYE